MPTSHIICVCWVMNTAKHSRTKLNQRLKTTYMHPTSFASMARLPNMMSFQRRGNAQIKPSWIHPTVVVEALGLCGNWEMEWSFEARSRRASCPELKAGMSCAQHACCVPNRHVTLRQGVEHATHPVDSNIPHIQSRYRGTPPSAYIAILLLKGKGGNNPKQYAPRVFSSSQHGFHPLVFHFGLE